MLMGLFIYFYRWDSGTNVGEFDGHSRRVLSCAFKPTRPFRIVTCGEDFLVNFYEGPPFKFKSSHRFVMVYVTFLELNQTKDGALVEKFWLYAGIIQIL